MSSACLRRLASLVACATALCGAPRDAASQVGGGSDACSDRRISRIVIENGDVYAPGPGDPSALRWASDVANLLHVRTRRAFIRRELLFAEGDCLDPFLLSESQRLLDGYGFLRNVRITEESDGAGGALVRVRTQDEWSTQVDLGVTYDDGLNVEKFQVTENNFMGNGVRAEVTRRHRRDDRSVSFALSTPRLFGRSDAYIRYGDSPGGTFFAQGVVYPFIGETNRTSVAEAYDRTTSFFTFAAGGDEPYSHVLVPLLEERFEVAGARRFGEPGRSTILGFSLTRDQPRLEGEAEYVIGSDFDGSLPGAGALPESILRQVGGRAATRASLHLGTRRYRYVEYEGLDAVRDVQTVGLGFFAGVSAGRAFDVFTPEGMTPAADRFGRVHASFGAPVGRSLLHGGITAEAGHASEGWRDILAEAELVAYGRASWLPAQTFFLRASSGGGWRTTIPFQLSLGGREGVRSLLDDQVPGGRRVLFIVEDRIRLGWPDWSAADLGITIFGDAGRMWAGDAPFGVDSPWHGSLGIGLRLGLPRGTRNIWRPDLVFPIGPGGGSPIFRVTFEINRIRSGFGTARLGRSRRFTRGPEHF